MVFLYVCLEVVDFSMAFACWDFVEPIRYGVCNVYVGVWGLVCCGWFLCLLVGMRFCSPRFRYVLEIVVRLCCVWSIEFGGL